jgi:hypothetical protein
MKHPVLRCAVAALLLSGVCPTHAADSYWYTGLGVGLSQAKFYPADFSGTAFIERKKEFDSGFKVFIGQQINRNWAAELSYATVGKFHYKYDNGSITQDGVYKVTGVGFSAVPTIGSVLFPDKTDFLQQWFCRGCQQCRSPVQRYESTQRLRSAIFFRWRERRAHRVRELRQGRRRVQP